MGLAAVSMSAVLNAGMDALTDNVPFFGSMLGDWL